MDNFQSLKDRLLISNDRWRTAIDETEARKAIYYNALKSPDASESETRRFLLEWETAEAAEERLFREKNHAEREVKDWLTRETTGYAKVVENPTGVGKSRLTARMVGEDMA